ncbi:hypothetical protein DFH09DRAFT_1331268 [Mycena vulgaris]|nr:hypothetical protein DFH09DRAFT_1331268 [Mycena vulgaris]
MSKFATCEGRTGKKPTLSPGELTPLVLDTFKYHCESYFSFKGTLLATQVATFLRCIRDVHIVNWLRPAAEKKHYLRKDWEQTTRIEVMSSRMEDNKSFDSYYTCIISLSSLLIDTAAELLSTRIRHIVEAGIIPDLQLALNNDAIVTAVDAEDLLK